ncbi:unnamed protein product [Phaedon cochleariae]|uniref:Uncharacterized protein n=1 Tax=Phaedon cochleariae TaxID=80249 RepID=A0A9N9WYA2_PHACE|nr:unnamed protein product [Phaedon cochleariae]
MDENIVYKWATSRTQHIMLNTLEKLKNSDETVATNQVDLVEENYVFISPVFNVPAESNQLQYTEVDPVPSTSRSNSDGKLVASNQADLIEMDDIFVSPVSNVRVEPNQLNYTEVDPVPSTSRSTTDGEIVVEHIVNVPDLENEHYDSDRDSENEPTENEIRDNKVSSSEDENENHTADELLPLHPPLFSPEFLVVNDTGTLLAVAGPCGVLVLQLPSRCPPYGAFEKNKEVVYCR